MISVVIATLNEQPQELAATIRSIYQTADREIEVVVVDDASRSEVPGLPAGNNFDVRVIRNRVTLGVGPSRHIGVCAAKGELVILCDGHMRFSPGWASVIDEQLIGHPDRLLCGQMLALEEGAEDLSKHSGVYNGARMVIYGNPKEEARYRILTAKWPTEAQNQQREGQDLYPLSAIMGACYAMHRSEFLRLGGLRLLQGFGLDEELLSIKWLRSGNQILMCKRLQAGHRCRKQKGPPPPYTIKMAGIFYNILMIAHTCTPPEVALDLEKKLGYGWEIAEAKKRLQSNWREIACERAYLDSVFRLSWPEYLGRIAEIDK